MFYFAAFVLGCIWGSFSNVWIYRLPNYQSVVKGRSFCTFCKEKIKTISSLTYNPELTLKKGNFSKLKPNKQDTEDIKKAVKTLNKLGNYTFSQGVVVRNKKLVAVEGRDGTQKMLKKCKSRKFRNKGVLVKFPKKKQDLRIDLPTVGLKTLTQCKFAGLKGVVLKSKRNIILERKECIKFANRNKMFITVK